MPPKGAEQSKKRKQGPIEPSRPKKRVKVFQHARTIEAQKADQAFKDGELDVAKFVQAREFEIRALEDSMQKSRKSSNQRAFQQVPRELRRRTASHNVKKVPKRLRRRAAREMIEDNTPTVTRRRREPTPHLHLRLETARRLQLLGEKAKARKQKRKTEAAMEVTVERAVESKSSHKLEGLTGVKIRLPRVKKNALRTPGKPPAKFRKRQINKTWLPTHIYHSKRAHMTPPKNPLWRFAIPLTPTMKGYRPTHRASTAQGAVAWDMSYISTISLEGPEKSIEGLLKALGVGAGGTYESTWGRQGQKWRRGTRTWQGWLYDRNQALTNPIAPVTIIWCPPAQSQGRKLFVRLHPSAFLQLWEEVLRLSKVQKPKVTVEDLRFEIGSIEVIGPQSTEALVATLRAAQQGDTEVEYENQTASVWRGLAPATNAASLPANALLAFNVSDPRLRFPPRALQNLQDPLAHQNLLQYCAQWPLDESQDPTGLFDTGTRLVAARSMRSQTSIDRRKGMAIPGTYPTPLPTDPHIPILLFASRGGSGSQAKWTVLMPWKCLGSVWRSLMYYPLSTGGQVRLGGLREQRQVAFEASLPWFPADYPGTKAGIQWEEEQRSQKKADWEKRPKGKRISWDTIPLGKGRKGEVGMGWACDWEYLFRDITNPQYPPKHIPRDVASEMIRSTNASNRETNEIDGLVVVKITLLTKGVPQTCARLYRLPTEDEELRRKWLDLFPRPNSIAAQVVRPQRLPAPTHVQNRYLATSLLNPMPPTPGSKAYPDVPAEEDLIGFITTGNFNLGEGKGIGIGSLRLSKMAQSVKSTEVVAHQRLCIVREAGQGVGRVARWELV
ncbi:POP1-domain-containing protein [Rhizodiscina lignyota]|uniref:POP1-domain-containing protein n=1 Tax=Rhizodiscina lignyota TaxID=1504668 RepID=A0A9P4IF76_9PEZI|nr:POP1-domain-containing protein [Rhizodiscina lignyota]